MSAGDIRMRPAGSPNRSIRSRHTLYHVTYLRRLEVSGLVTLGVVIVTSECREPRGSGVMKTVMRPRPAGHGLPWSGPVNGPLDTTDVSSPVTSLIVIGLLFRLGIRCSIVFFL